MSGKIILKSREFAGIKNLQKCDIPIREGERILGVRSATLAGSPLEHFDI